MPVSVSEYRRSKAVSYAHDWAYGRNPKYYNYEKIGGDCTNFASQCIFAGSGVMNYGGDLGWYYFSANNKSPSWTGVAYLRNFLVNNRLGVGPFAAETGIESAAPGDIIQLSFDGQFFTHSPVVVSADPIRAPANILVAVHSFDCDNRPLNTYDYKKLRCLHILGVRK